MLLLMGFLQVTMRDVEKLTSAIGWTNGGLGFTIKQMQKQIKQKKVKKIPEVTHPYRV